MSFMIGEYMRIEYWHNDTEQGRRNIRIKPFLLATLYATNLTRTVRRLNSSY